MRILLIVMACIYAISSNAQNTIEEVLANIENNNKTLQVLRAEADVVKMQNKVGLNPSNPEVQYTYQWGKNESMGTRSELSIIQTLDFPTAYLYRGQMANALINKADIDYKIAFNEVMLNAVELCYRAFYGKMLIDEYQKRLDHAESIAEVYRYKLETGDVNIIESNKAQLNLLNAKNNLVVLKADQQAVIEKLTGINGGLPIDITQLLIVHATLPEDFDTWFTNMKEVMPEMISLQKGVEANRKKEQLNRALSLPKLSGGYSSEKGLTDSFKGINMGISIPLWENKNTVKQVQLKIVSLENQMEDLQLQAYHGLKSLYNKAESLKSTIDDYQQVLDKLHSNELLKIALDAGEISVLDFIVEQSIYYEAIENFVSVQLQYDTTMARLNYFHYK
ncbi:TolC family protein [Carboxylicivirga caseinilyticus]|uniref:TolC family protein n=1 Tax=Carboxylicivirga caseinilyticus TaxID=3417572 RepID=UPI003D32C806|nr:TolC family protein [Marinilabiliaceae bacterium A049]